MEQRHKENVFLVLFLVIILALAYFNSSLQSQSIANQTLLFYKQPVIVTQAEETNMKYVYRLIFHINRIDPTREIHIYVNSKQEWNKDLLNIQNVFVKEISKINSVQVPRNSNFLLPVILLDILQTRNAAVFIHPLWVLDSLRFIDESIAKKGYYLLRGSNPKCIVPVQGYYRNSPAYKDVLMKSYESLLTDPGNEQFSSYYSIDKGTINPKILDSNSYQCEGDLNITPLIPLNPEYQIRYKFKEPTRKKNKFISSRIGLLLGEVKDVRNLKKTIQNLINGIPQTKAQYSFFIYGYSKTKNLIASGKNNYFPLKETIKSKSITWGINAQYDEAIKDDCEYSCTLIDSTTPPKDFRPELRSRSGLGVYIEENTICVSKIHWEIFGSMFPHSFRDLKPHLFQKWIRAVYTPFSAVTGSHHSDASLSKKEEIYLEVETTKGIKKIKEYKNKHVI